MIVVVTVFGAGFVVWLPWWCIIGRKLRTRPIDHPWEDQVMRPTLKGETERWKKQNSGKTAVPFRPVELGLRFEGEIVCGVDGARV